MPLTITKSNETVPVIPNDSYPGTNLYLYSVYQNIPFSIDLTFALTEVTEETTTIIPITSIVSSFTTYNTVNFTTLDTDPSAYKIRVSGTLTDVLTGEYYTLLLKDKTLANFPTNDLPDYEAVVSWFLPNYFSTSISTYSFNVNSGTEIVTMSQYVYWDFDTGLTSFRQAIAEGI